MTSFTQQRASINQKIQIGAESTAGTAVPASKQLTCFDWTFGINADVQTYKPTGHKYPTVQEENTEWVDGTLAGVLDYNGIIYPLSGVMGSTSPTGHGASTTAKDWIFTPPVSGVASPETYTIQQGDSTRAFQLSYGLFTAFGFKGDRKSFNVSGSLIGQAITDGISLTSSPSVVPLAPIIAKQFNVYLDSAYGSLGTTLLASPLQVDYGISGVYQPFWPLNRSFSSYASHVDLAPTATVKVMLEADSQGMGLLTNLQTGTTQFLRVQAIGSQIASDGPGAVYNTYQHDFAVKVGKPSTFQDKDGIFAIEWTMQIVEDAGWGHSQLVTVTNLISAL